MCRKEGLTEKRRQRSSHGECTFNISAICSCMSPCLPDQHVDNVHKRETSKGEVTPLIVAGNKRTNKSSNDHDLVNDDNPQERRPWHASRK